MSTCSSILFSTPISLPLFVLLSILLSFSMLCESWLHDASMGCVERKLIDETKRSEARMKFSLWIFPINWFSLLDHKPSSAHRFDAERDVTRTEIKTSFLVVMFIYEDNKNVKFAFNVITARRWRCPSIKPSLCLRCEVWWIENGPECDRNSIAQQSLCQASSLWS